MSDTTYQMITDRIIELLEHDIVPWERPWRYDTRDGLPRNIRGTHYRGINQLLLGIQRLRKGYDTNLWLTYHQAQEHGGHIKKGEKATPVIFWKRTDQPDRPRDQVTIDGAAREDEVSDDAPARSRWLLRYYSAFNLGQAEGVCVPPSLLPGPKEHGFPPLEACERIVHGMPRPPPISEGDDRAFYLPLEDRIWIPRREQFRLPGERYSTLFHELVHCTGHPSRLGRYALDEFKSHQFGSPAYSREELVAEIGSAMLCAVGGIHPTVIQNQAAYVQHWIGKLQNDKRLIITAAGQAQKAADYILNKQAEAGSS